MRLRKKWWVRPELEKDSKVITNPRELKGIWKENFKNNNDIFLELGCGRGDFAVTKAKNNPDINYIAVDLKDEVLIYVLNKANEAEVENIRIVPLNISFISEIFSENEVSKIFINFCNPWPKDRHKKRRLTHTKFLDEYKKFLKKDSEIWFKTDDKELFDESQEYFKEAGFEIEYLTYDLHKSDFKENIVTEYESKWTSMGMNIMFLIGRLKKE